MLRKRDVYYVENNVGERKHTSQFDRAEIKNNIFYLILYISIIISEMNLFAKKFIKIVTFQVPKAYLLYTLYI